MEGNYGAVDKNGRLYATVRWRAWLKAALTFTIKQVTKIAIPFLLCCIIVQTPTCTGATFTNCALWDRSWRCRVRLLTERAFRERVCVHWAQLDTGCI